MQVVQLLLDNTANGAQRMVGRLLLAQRKSWQQNEVTVARMLFREPVISSTALTQTILRVILV